MGQRDPRIDAYIAKAAPFARPILEHLRALVHRAAPEIVETVKWGMPFFVQGGNVCHMAAFKAHCGFGFWRGGLAGGTGKEGEAMGQFGRLTTLDDLPPERELVALVRAAVAANASGVKKPARPRAPRPEAEVPEDLARALRSRGNAAARKTFEGFAPSHRREYIEWIVEAKTEATRARRLATTLDWLAEGKSRNWRYERPAKQAAVPRKPRKSGR